MRLLKNMIRNEDGQILVFVAIAMVAIMGFAAIAIDTGMVAIQKSNLQNAADAAALAGAQELPSESNAIAKAIAFADKNGLKVDPNGVGKDGDTIKVNAKFGGDSNKIEVVCTRMVNHSFARVLGFTHTDVSARAVAEKKTNWEGEGLPFINFENSFLTIGTKVDAWSKEGPGYFERIHNFEIMNNKEPYDKIYFQLKIEEGLQIENDKVADIKHEIGYYYNTHKSTLVPKPYVYMFSLSPKAFKTGKVILQNGSEKNIEDLINKSDYVSLKSLVLVKCTFDGYDEKILELTSVATYDLGNNDKGYPDLPDYPLDYVGPNGSGSTLLE